jgi:hypothetical protein
MRFGCVAMAFAMGCVASSRFIETSQLQKLARGAIIEDTRGNALDMSAEDDLRVMLRGDCEVVVSHYEVQNGVLIGTLLNGEIAVVPLAIIDYARVRHVNPAKVIGLVVGVLAGVGILIAAMVAQQHGYTY